MKKEVFVAAGLIFENGKLFATRRGECKYPYVAHKYEFPGGKIEFVDYIGVPTSIKLPSKS